MGGRGGSGSRGGSRDGTITATKPSLIETVYREARGYSNGYYKNEVLEATTDGKGNLTFSYPKDKSFEKTAKTNRTNYVTYNVVAGAVDGRSFGIDWSKVNSISGQTYSMRKEAKEAGLKWNGKEKKWSR